MFSYSVEQKGKLILIYMLMTQSYNNLEQLEVILQSALAQLFIWLVANKLKLSAPKSTCMVIGSRQHTYGRALDLFLMILYYGMRLQ